MPSLKQAIKKLLKKPEPDWSEKFQKISYSQSGEDVIADFVFEQLKIEMPTYLDIGAHHPTFYNNTYRFYQRGARGVNIEPDPFLIQAFKEKRREDINLNMGVGTKNYPDVADFYIMSSRTLNTFSKEEAERYQENGLYKIDSVKQIPLISVNEVIEKYLNGKSPNLVSIDVEGLDLAILKDFDFSKWRPEIFCVETLTFTADKTEQKIEEIISFVESQGYFSYADTNINTIFVDQLTWKNRKGKI